MISTVEIGTIEKKKRIVYLHAETCGLCNIFISISEDDLDTENGQCFVVAERKTRP